MTFQQWIKKAIEKKHKENEHKQNENEHKQNENKDKSDRGTGLKKAHYHSHNEQN